MAKKIPKFSYTGQCSTGSDDTYWYIFLTTSGTLTFEYAKAGVDVGCVGGGGQPIAFNQELARERAAVLNTLDGADVLRYSHENPDIAALYERLYERPLSEKAEKLLHTDQLTWDI